MKSRYQELNNLQSKLKSDYQKACKKLSRAPEGQLLVTNEHGYLKYIHITQESGVRSKRGIGRDSRLIGKLANKAYLEEYRKRLEKNIALINSISDRCVSLDPLDIIGDMPARFASIDPRTMITGGDPTRRWPNPSSDTGIEIKYPGTDTGDLTPEEWGAMPYRENIAFPESKVHYSSRAIACRSKSEVAILELYDSLGIPYHYDETLQLSGELVSPDYIGARSDGKLIYHEHFGLNDPEYIKRAARKTELYRNASIIQGKNLICTYDREDGSLNLALIEALLKDAYNLT